MAAIEDNRDRDQLLAWDVDTGARRLGISKNAAYRALKNGEIPSVRIGRRILIPVSALEDFLRRAGGHE
jgi:excisionase family DNA binding protein